MNARLQVLQTVYLQDISKQIKKSSENYVELYWKKKTRGKDVIEDEKDPFKDLMDLLENMPDEEVTKLLNDIAKKNMSLFYNMLIPEQVLGLIFYFYY